MPGKGVKRTNTSDTSVLNDSESKKPSKKKSKKKSKSKSTKDNSGVNTGDCTGDIANVNKPSNTPFTPNVLDTTNTSVNMSQQNFSQDPNFIYPYNPGPNAGFMTQNQHLCSSPTPGMYPPPIHHMQHISPPAQPASTQQRPTWVDELFRRMDKFENKLNKLDQIDSFVTSLNAKVIRLEQGTKSLDERLDQVEKSTQLISDDYDTHKQNFTDIKAELNKISSQLKTNNSNVNTVDKKLSASLDDMKRENDRLQNELLEVQMKAMSNNLIFYNIPEVNDENCRNTIGKFCEEKLKIENPSNIVVTDAYRLGKKGTNNRPILVKFSSFENRDNVKKSAKKLKGSNFGISEQLPLEIQKRRKEKLPIMKQLRDQDVKAYFVKDKIFVGGKEYTP
ncbi:unnamed protein product [Mytilus coruscus]|uniref:RRM domain-containing protein n=1 Tax=Mytilus coruscus TaxID=42192 RepID=A0A6J8B810_MYTCO|nr:unnamed protein product [Mytilus coruscus]